MSLPGAPGTGRCVSVFAGAAGTGHVTNYGDPAAFRMKTRRMGRECRTSLRFKHSGAPEGTSEPHGKEARLLNVSRGGILLETASELAPGAAVFVRLVAADAVFLLRGQVCRTRQTLLRDADFRYESAVAFDGSFPRPAAAAIAGQEELRVAPAGGPSAEETAGVRAQCMPAYTVTVSIPRSGPELHQIFGLNRW
jgi:hypothetical protein